MPTRSCDLHSTNTSSAFKHAVEMATVFYNRTRAAVILCVDVWCVYTGSSANTSLLGKWLSSLSSSLPLACYFHQIALICLYVEWPVCVCVRECLCLCVPHSGATVYDWRTSVRKLFSYVNGIGVYSVYQARWRQFAVVASLAR